MKTTRFAVVQVMVLMVVWMLIGFTTTIMVMRSPGHATLQPVAVIDAQASPGATLALMEGLEASR